MVLFSFICHGYTSYYTKDLSNLYITSYVVFWKFSTYFISLRLFTIVGLEEATHTIQLGMFPSARKVRTNPYYTILIDIYDFLF